MKKNIFKEVGEEWGDYLKTENKVNKEKFEIKKEYDIDDLLKCYKKWKIKRTNKIFEASYEIAEETLKKYKIPFLSEDEINEFVEKTKLNEPEWRGIFVSAIVNKLYKDDEIMLDSSSLSHFGSYSRDKKIVVNGDCNKLTGADMESGEMVIKGNCGPWTGGSMKSGKIVIEGDSGYGTGANMEGGKIIVEGDCGYGIGNSMLGGEIRIYGDDFKPNEHIFKWARKGKIYHKDKLVWEDGKFIGEEK